MDSFAQGETRLLVATTVIEVGVDVPEATVMVIEHAERFGLAQLHQLRGRVGRGTEHSSCLLLYRAPLGETAKARLAIMRETEDGFRIAEEDLKLRGEGDVLGTRQSGMPGFRLARVETHGKLLQVARDDAALVLARDPELTSARGEALRTLLYLFERDEAIRLSRAGRSDGLRKIFFFAKSARIGGPTWIRTKLRGLAQPLRSRSATGPNPSYQMTEE